MGKKTKIGAGFKEKPSTVEAEAFLGPIDTELEPFFKPGVLSNRQACADMRATALRLAMQGRLNPRWLQMINELGRDTSAHMAVKEAGDKLAQSNLLVGLFREAAKLQDGQPSPPGGPVILAQEQPALSVRDTEDTDALPPPDEEDEYGGVRYEDDPPEPQERPMITPVPQRFSLSDLFGKGK